jgi:uncharacterized membrane protein
MYYVIVIVGVVISAFAQILLKRSSAKETSFVRQYINWRVITGYALIFSALLMDLYAMHNGIKAKEVSTLESLSYLFVPVLSILILKERISVRKWIGIAIIITGIILFFIE